MNLENEHNLSIRDPESGITYNLLLSTEDVQRAHEDQHFLNSLLFHAQVTNTAKRVTDSATESSTIAVATEGTESQESSNGDNKNVKPNYVWQYNQVVDLIKSMGTHIDDLNHPRKRKQVFENVANDLVSCKYSVNAAIGQSKWNSLLKSYRKAKDNTTKTGRSPSRFNFFELMDELLGSNPTNSCSHALNSEKDMTDEILELPVTSPSNVSVSSEASDDIRHRTNGKTSEKKLKREYIELKRKEFEKRQKRHDERVELEREKIELERRKYDLLEKYLNSKE